MDASTGGGYAGLLFWFLAIVALIPASLWLLKRSRLGGALNATGAVKVVSHTALGPGQKLLIVEVQHPGAAAQTLLLGVTAHQINLVRELTPAPGARLSETA